MTTARYSDSDSDSAFRLGEILEGIQELRFEASQTTSDAFVGPSPSVQRVSHPWCIILTPDCDLEWDFKSRNTPSDSGNKLVTHLLLCSLEDRFALENDKRITKSGGFKRAQSYRDERYHYLSEIPAADAPHIPEYFIDFKRLFSVPLDYAYKAVELGLVNRHRYLNPPWVQHLTHRFTFFLGRVGLSDEEE